MAVIDTVPGIKVDIKSNGATLPEYDDAEGRLGSINRVFDRDIRPKQDKLSSTFIECISDSEFSISMEVDPRFDLGSGAMGLSFWCIVDGKRIGGHTVHRKKLHTRYECVISETWGRVSPTEVMMKKLKFAAIQKGTCFRE